jgi:hypothetical protein
MKPAVRKALQSAGWMLGLAVLAAFMVGAFGPPWTLLSYGMIIIAALLTIGWIKMGWKASTEWFGKVIATTTMVVVSLLYAAVLYVGWLGAR